MRTGVAGLGGEMADRFWRVLREVRPASISRDAERSFCVLICGQAGVGKATLRGALNGGEWPTDLTLPYLRIVEGLPGESYGASLCLYVLDASRGLLRGHWQDAAVLADRGLPVVYVFNKMDLAPDAGAFREAARQMFDFADPALAFVSASDAEDVRRRLVPAALEMVPDLRLALGRRLPAFRDEAARQVVVETARVNAEFAILSSLPASLPLVSLGAAGADIVVLTKNQAMMLFKLAAIYGRPLRSRFQVVAELAPVVASAFLWRMIARAAVSLLPGFVAVAPRAAVAFVGTYVVGSVAQHYYRLGRRPSKEAIDSFTREALVAARRSLPRLHLPGRLGGRALLPPGRMEQPDGQRAE